LQPLDLQGRIHSAAVYNLLADLEKTLLVE